VNGLVGTEVATEKAADQVPVDGGIISGEVDIFQFRADTFKVRPQFPYLSGLARSIQTFKYYQHFDR
jgi:hypothetical protein